MGLHWNVIRAVFRRNFVSYFSNPIGYLFITAFVWACAYFAFWHNDSFFANNLADLDPLNQFFPYLLLFFVPAITMSAWAEERKSGTEELLLTLPASDLEVVLGKYLSCLAIYTVALGFSAFNFLVLVYLGSPDWGLILGTYLGYWLIGAALLAAGMVASLLTANVTVAFILGAAICLVLVYIHQLGTIASPDGFLRRWLEDGGVVPQFQPFGRGLLSLASIFYFASVAIVMLYLNIVLLSRRHWGGSPDAASKWFHYLSRAASIAVAAVSLTFIAKSAEAYLKVDVTEERIHSLSADTRKILAEIDPSRPVLVEAFVSPKVPKDYVETRRNLLDLLRQYDALAGGKLEVKIHEVELFTPEATEAEEVYGIAKESVMASEDGREGTQDIFLGVSCRSGLNQKTIPFFYRGLPIEYELTRIIRTVSQATKRKVGILTTDAGLFGQFNFQTMAPPRDWLIVAELKQQYDVVQVSPDTPIESTYDCLVVPMASSLTQTQMDHLTDYVLAGGATLILDDPMPIMVNPRLAPREPKQSPNQNPMFGGQPPPGQKGDMTRLLDALHIRFNSGTIVWQDWNPYPEFRELSPEYVFIGKGNGNLRAFNPDQAVSSGLQQLLLIYPGSIEPKGGEGPKFTPLLTTNDLTGELAYSEVFDQGGFFGMRQLKQFPKRRPTRTEYVLAAYIHGPFGAEAAPSPADTAEKAGAEGEKPKAKEANVIFIADLDMISDGFFEFRRARYSGQEKFNFDNVSFVLNSVDMLAGDASFVDLRKKRPKRRNLDRIARMADEVAAATRKNEEQAEATAEASLAKAQAQLDAKVAEINKRTDLDKRSKQAQIEYVREIEQRKFDVEKSKVEADLRKEKRRLQDKGQLEIRAEQQRFKLMAVLIPPIPVLLIGVAVFFRRISGEKEGVDPGRLLE